MAENNSVLVVEARGTARTGYLKTKKFKEKVSRVKIWVSNGVATQHPIKLAAMLVLAALLMAEFAPHFTSLLRRADEGV